MQRSVRILFPAPRDSSALICVNGCSPTAHRWSRLDNLLTGSRGNLEHLAQSRVPVLEHDVTLPASTDRRALSMPCCTLASLASPKDYLAHPIETLESDRPAPGTCSISPAATSARFLVTSTSECYGDPLEHPQVETYWGNVNPGGPALLLRREQALRRGDDHGLPPHARRADQYRADLQHLRPAHAA